MGTRTITHPQPRRCRRPIADLPLPLVAQRNPASGLTAQREEMRRLNAGSQARRLDRSPARCHAGPGGLRQRRRRWIGGSANPDGVVSIGIAEPKHLVPEQHHRDQRLPGARRAVHARWSTSTRPEQAGTRSPPQSITTTDNKVWTIKLKDGYTFHNGEPVTADNYINAWNYGAYGPNAPGQQLLLRADRGLRATLADPAGRPEGRRRRRRPVRPEEGRRPDLHGDAVRAVQRVQDDAGLHRVLPAAEGRVRAPRRAQRRTTSRRRSATAPSR